MRHSEQRARSDQIARHTRGETRGIQIGPRIRVGGTVGKIGQKIKSNLPFLAAPAGLPAILEAEAIKHGASIPNVAKGFGQDLKTGAKNIPLAIGIQAATGGGVPKVPGIPGVTDGGNGGSPFGLGDVIDYGLGAANTFNAAQLGQKSSQYAEDAKNAVVGSYNERAPLRIAGIEGMLHPDAQNAAKLAGVNAIQGPQIAAQPLPLGPTDPRLAMVNRTQGRGNPWSQPPLPLR